MRLFDATVAVGALALAAALGTTATAQADRGSGSGDGGDNQEIRMEDDCDPATFNAALGEGACLGDGDTTFDELIAELIAQGSADKWRNNPDDTHIDDDEGLRVKNRGGEAHTFTMVAAFGPGCVPELNEILHLEGPPAADCGAAFAGILASGQSSTISAASLAPGTHFFQCMIHPWMQTTVDVRHDH